MKTKLSAIFFVVFWAWPTFSDNCESDSRILVSRSWKVNVEVEKKELELGKLSISAGTGRLEREGELEKLERMRELEQLENPGEEEQLELRDLKLEDVDLNMGITLLGPQGLRMEADALTKARAAKYDKIMGRPSSSRGFTPIIPTLPTPTAEEALQSIKARFYERMVSQGHWADTKYMVMARQEYKNYLGNLSRRKKELAETIRDIEDDIGKKWQQILAGDLDNQQKAFLEANIADQRKKHKETAGYLEKNYRRVGRKGANICSHAGTAL